MKTLDEVIKALEICANEDTYRTCKDCPYPDNSMCINYLQNDALHYLKEYRDAKDKIDSTRLAYLDILTDYVALKNYWAEQQENEPLTWDELKQMEGKPVWVEYGTFSDSGWALISEISEQGCIEFLLSWGLRLVMQKGAIGKTWQAYRKERK